MSSGASQEVSKIKAIQFLSQQNNPPIEVEYLDMRTFFIQAKVQNLMPLFQVRSALNFSISATLRLTPYKH